MKRRGFLAAVLGMLPLPWLRPNGADASDYDAEWVNPRPDVYCSNLIWTTYPGQYPGPTGEVLIIEDCTWSGKCGVVKP